MNAYVIFNPFILSETTQISQPEFLTWKLHAPPKFHLKYSQITTNFLANHFGIPLNTTLENTRQLLKLRFHKTSFNQFSQRKHIQGTMHEIKMQYSKLNKQKHITCKNNYSEIINLMGKELGCLQKTVWAKIWL